MGSAGSFQRGAVADSAFARMGCSWSKRRRLYSRDWRRRMRRGKGTGDMTATITRLSRANLRGSKVSMMTRLPRFTESPLRAWRRTKGNECHFEAGRGWKTRKNIRWQIRDSYDIPWRKEETLGQKRSCAGATPEAVRPAYSSPATVTVPRP